MSIKFSPNLLVQKEVSSKIFVNHVIYILQLNY